MLTSLNIWLKIGFLIYVLDFFGDSLTFFFRSSFPRSSAIETKIGFFPFYLFFWVNYNLVFQKSWTEQLMGFAVQQILSTFQTTAGDHL